MVDTRERVGYLLAVVREVGKVLADLADVVDQLFELKTGIEETQDCGISLHVMK